MSKEKLRIAIIGAGVSGLRTADLLVKRYGNKIKSLEIFEKSSLTGGVMRSTQRDGFLLEHGPQGVLTTRESFMECVTELQLEDELVIPPPQNTKRFLMEPHSLVSLSPLSLIHSKVLSIKDVIRMVAEIFIPRPKRKNPDETLFDFVKRRFGKSFALVFAIAISHGIWAGGARYLLLRHVFPEMMKLEFGYGSLIKAFLWKKARGFFKKEKPKISPTTATFKKGMSVLTDTLLKSVEQQCMNHDIEFLLHLQTPVKKIQHFEEKFLLETGRDTPPQDCIIYTGQPWREGAPKLEMNSHSLEDFKILQETPAHSLAVVGLGASSLPKGMQPPVGFGALAGAKSNDILGVLFIHSIAPPHVPHGGVLFRLMIGGERDPDAVKKSDEELIKIARERLEETKVTPKGMQYSFTEVVRWPHYIPLATLHRDASVAAMWRLEAEAPGLFFTGNYTGGVSVADCLEWASITADKVGVFAQLKTSATENQTRK